MIHASYNRGRSAAFARFKVGNVPGMAGSNPVLGGQAATGTQPAPPTAAMPPKSAAPPIAAAASKAHVLG